MSHDFSWNWYLTPPAGNATLPKLQQCGDWYKAMVSTIFLLVPKRTSKPPFPNDSELPQFLGRLFLPNITHQNAELLSSVRQEIACYRRYIVQNNSRERSESLSFDLWLQKTYISFCRTELKEENDQKHQIRLPNDLLSPESSLLTSYIFPPCHLFLKQPICLTGYCKPHSGSLMEHN